MEGTRSMSKKGYSPDNSACEGLFGRIKNELFYGRDWMEVSLENFEKGLDEYLHWYNEDRIKESLGFMSPAGYRVSLGIAAQIVRENVRTISWHGVYVMAGIDSDGRIYRDENFNLMAEHAIIAAKVL